MNYETNRIALGGTLFGWTLNRQQSFEILDYFFFNLGQNIIDTADSYSQWKTGNIGGESEQIIGEWITSRKILRKDIVLVTKIGQKKDRKGYSFKTCQLAITESLERLQTDYIDLLFIHHPPNKKQEIVPLAKTIHEINKGNSVLNFGLSNFSKEQISIYLEESTTRNGPNIFAIQNHYNLLERDSTIYSFDNYSKKTNLGVSSEILPWIKNQGAYLFAYHALCRGVLTNRFLEFKGVDTESIHAERTLKYATPEVINFLLKVKRIALKYNCSIENIAISWLINEYSRTIPVLSCKSISQLKQLERLITLKKNEFEELDFLSYQKRLY